VGVVLEIIGGLFLLAVVVAAIEGLWLAWVFVGVAVVAVIVAAVQR
jgi:hypothetical protein